MAKSTLKIKLPIFVGAEDYHEFSPFTDALSKLTGTPVVYRELSTEPGVGYDVDVKLGASRSFYFAIVYSGPEDDHIRQEMRDFLGDEE